jgi:hypothetical protein
MSDIERSAPDSRSVVFRSLWNRRYSLQNRVANLRGFLVLVTSDPTRTAASRTGKVFQKIGETISRLGEIKGNFRLRFPRALLDIHSLENRMLDARSINFSY